MKETQISKHVAQEKHMTNTAPSTSLRKRVCLGDQEEEGRKC